MSTTTLTKGSDARRKPSPAANLGASEAPQTLPADGLSAAALLAAYRHYTKQLLDNVNLCRQTLLDRCREYARTSPYHGERRETSLSRLRWSLEEAAQRLADWLIATGQATESDLDGDEPDENAELQAWQEEARAIGGQESGVEPAPHPGATGALPWREDSAGSRNLGLDELDAAGEIEALAGDGGAEEGED